MTRDPALFLEDMQEAGRYILEMSRQGPSVLEDKTTHDAIIHNFEVMGEATKGVPLDLQDRAPRVPWTDLLAFRNRLSHGYFRVDTAIVWRIMEDELPAAVAALEDLVRGLA